MMQPVMKFGWVKAVIIERYKGITSEALRKKQGCQLTEGFHWRKAADGNVYYNYENIDEWLSSSEKKAG